MDTETPCRDTLAIKAREVFAYLCSMLPPIGDDGPDDRETRARRAMQAVLAQHAYDDFEARLAARIVAMAAQSGESLRLSGLVVNDTIRAMVAALLRRAAARDAEQARPLKA
jgi:hypothetical protein